MHITTGNGDLFKAKPIMIEEDDEILRTATKLEELSNSERDVYLLVATDESSELDTTSSTTNPPDSLPVSEDSDTTRIYDVQTMETRYENGSSSSRKPINTVATAPDSVKCFAPKQAAKESFSGNNGRKGSDGSDDDKLKGRTEKVSTKIEVMCVHNCDKRSCKNSVTV